MGKAAGSNSGAAGDYIGSVAMAGGGGVGASISQGGSAYTFERETEKAVMVKATINVEYAPQGGFTSSLIKEKTITTNTWIPKSQIYEGSPSNWILRTKEKELAESNRPLGGRVLRSTATFTDASGKAISGVELPKEREWKQQREQNKQTNKSLKKTTYQRRMKLADIISGLNDD